MRVTAVFYLTERKINIKMWEETNNGKNERRNKQPDKRGKGHVAKNVKFFDGFADFVFG